VSDRVHYHLDLIFSVGTQVVTLDVPGSAAFIGSGKSPFVVRFSNLEGWTLGDPIYRETNFPKSCSFRSFRQEASFP
jgi:hypothetical protein